MKERNEHLLDIVLASVLVKVVSLAFVRAWVGPDLLGQLSTKWDSVFYVDIARNGYQAGVLNANYAFAPLYPLLIRLVASVGGDYLLSAAIVANVFSIVVPVLFYFVARMYFGPRSSLNAALALTFFPTFVTYGLVSYSEPVYLFLSMLSLYFFLKGRYLLVGVASSLGVLASYVNLLVPVLLVGIVVLRWVHPRLPVLRPPVPQAEPVGAARAGTRWYHSVWLLAPLLVFGLWMYALDVRSGQLYSIIAAQAPWGTHLANPVAQFQAFFTGIFSTQGNPVQQLLIRYMYTLPFFALAVPLWKIDRWLALYSSAVMLFTLSLVGTAYASGPRLMLSAWPLLLVFGGAKREHLIPLLMIFAVLSLQSTYTHLTGFWT